MRIHSIATAFPEHRFSSDEIAEWTGADADFIRNKVGIKERAYLTQGESMVDLAAAAVRNLFEGVTDLEPGSVELLLLVTQNPEFRLPHTSALLQDALGLPQSCACFDVNLGCSGFVYALTIAKTFMSAQGIENGIIVTCDPYSSIMRKDDRNTVAVFGDGATATLLNSRGALEIGKGDFGTDGSGAEDLIVKAGGAAEPVGGLWNEEHREFEPDDLRLHMNGRAIFNFMMTKIPGSVENCLIENKKSLDDIDLFAFHQGSKFLVESLGSSMKLPPEKVLCDLEHTGNTVSSTIPLLLAAPLSKGELVHKTVLVSGFGVGLSWATNLLTHI